MRIVAAVIAALLASPALAQDKPIPRYGEEEKAKTPEQKAQEREAEKAYRRSLGNIPEQKSVDPWGNVRGDAPKQDTKAPAAKKTKTGSSGN